MGEKQRLSKTKQGNSVIIPICKESTSKEEMPIIKCISEVKRIEQFLRSEKTPQNPPYDFKTQKQPDWTNEDLEFDGQIVNLNKLSCSCNDSKTKRNIYPKNDLRLICKHIYRKILSAEKYFCLFDGLAILLIKSNLSNAEKMLIKSKVQDNNATFYIGGSREGKSFNIYAEADDKWKKYNYSLKDKKWEHDNCPINSETILETLERNEFIFDKYLNEEE